MLNTIRVNRGYLSNACLIEGWMNVLINQTMIIDCTSVRLNGTIASF